MTMNASTGNHCCVCQRVCMHVGGPYLCDEHRRPAPVSTTPVAPTYEPLPAFGGLIAAERDELRAEVASLRQQLDEARGELEAAQHNAAAYLHLHDDVDAEREQLRAERDRLLVVYRAAEGWAETMRLLLALNQPVTQPSLVLMNALNAYRSAAPAEPAPQFVVEKWRLADGVDANGLPVMLDNTEAVFVPAKDGDTPGELVPGEGEQVLPVDGAP